MLKRGHSSLASSGGRRPGPCLWRSEQALAGRLHVRHCALRCNRSPGLQGQCITPTFTTMPMYKAAAAQQEAACTVASSKGGAWCALQQRACGPVSVPNCAPASESCFPCCAQLKWLRSLRQAAAHLTEHQDPVTLLVQLDQELVQQLELAALLPHLLTAAQQAWATATKVQVQVDPALHRQNPSNQDMYQVPPAAASPAAM